MVKNTSRLETRISTDLKIRWEQFLLSHHDTIRGEYGPELERAMELYMNQFSQVSNYEKRHVNINKTTRNVLKLISIAFRELPSYPIVEPIVVNAVVKNSIRRDDSRSHNRYLKIVIEHLKSHVLEDGTEKKSVKEFCEYVDRLLNENSLK